MDPLETAALDETRLGERTRRFATDLFARFPELRQHAAMKRYEGHDGWVFVVTVAAPSGDPRSELLIWAGGGEEPSVEFAGFHTHESVWGPETWNEDHRAALLDLIAGIFADRFVGSVDVGGLSEHPNLLDLSKPDALLEELTGPYSPGRARLRSWSGRLDREVSVDDLNGDAPA